MEVLSSIEATAPDRWRAAAPETVGVSPAAVERFCARLAQEQLDVFGVLMHRNGHLFAERYWPPHAVDERNLLYSLSKSFTSCLCGIAASEGLVDLDRPLIEYFPDEAPKDPAPNLARMKVKHLLNMNTGHAEEVDWRADDVIRSFLTAPVPHEPGTHFLYHNAATLMISALIQKQSGQTLVAYGKERLFDPLGIASPRWDMVQGMCMGATGLYLSVREIARFGRMLLQEGRFAGRQIVPSDYLAIATSRQGPSRNDDPADDWGNGYGYQFWRNSFGGFRGDGMLGQYCVVVPDLDLCLATESNVPPMERILVLFREEIVEPLRASIK